ncbi:hypothetical protein NLG97_g4601 [Lecanicillium saksenae]|uniref:Uncharacterized protein n=1 Tax=Lecanicillium saksenae TaxID=468837 RepID=A0ACC1QV11_9HYPO|nr:hypothetical protein NLG97_g4601 [Lecanicillium saksenae]
MSTRPSFDSLPLRKDGPPGNAWGLYGDDDELGTLNLLTPENTANAAKQIIDGTRVPTDWPLGAMQPPAFGRQVFKHDIIHKAPRFVNDDIVTFNTQSSTQWDGFRHFAAQKQAAYYNGTTQEQIMNSNRIGTHAWVETGGIVGRGVLLDWAAWAEKKGLKVDLHSEYSITAETLNEVAESQGTTFKQGDILFIRTGFTLSYESLSKEAKTEVGKTTVDGTIGIESSKETLKWIWDNGFAAIAGDQPALEALPFKDREYVLHQWLLPGWGMPIGELFNLQKLSEECQKRQRWTFFFTSMPIYVKGGVASPPNGIAIF